MPDGTVRTPIWLKGEYVTPDQYELVRDTGKRMKYGTRTSARAKPGTRFYDRMASWPMAFEEGMKEACRRHFPVGEFSIYVHGHSTGGPYVSMLSQRVPNIAGVIAIENSTFGYHQREEAPVGRPRRQDRGLCRRSRRRARESWKDPFNDLYIRTWRDLARYRGSEALGQEGPHGADAAALADGGNPRRLGGRAQAAAVQGRIHDHAQHRRRARSRRRALPRRGSKHERRARPRSSSRTISAIRARCRAPGVKPVPPFLFVISKDSRDHSPGGLSRGHHPDV